MDARLRPCGLVLWRMPDDKFTHYSDVILTMKEAQPGLAAETQQIRDSLFPKNVETLDEELLLTQRCRLSHLC